MSHDAWWRQPGVGSLLSRLVLSSSSKTHPPAKTKQIGHSLLAIPSWPFPPGHSLPPHTLLAGFNLLDVFTCASHPPTIRRWPPPRYEPCPFYMHPARPGLPILTRPGPASPYSPRRAEPVMVCPLALHTPPSPHSRLRQSDPFPTLLDRPPTPLSCRPTSHSLSQTRMFLLAFFT